jgi:hypothetical protein
MHTRTRLSQAPNPQTTHRQKRSISACWKPSLATLPTRARRARAWASRLCRTASSELSVLSCAVDLYADDYCVPVPRLSEWESTLGGINDDIGRPSMS